GADAVVMAAAVADFRPAASVPGKLSRRDPGARDAGAALSVELQPNPDILAELGRGRRAGVGRPYLIGFAAETAGGAELAAGARAGGAPPGRGKGRSMPDPRLKTYAPQAVRHLALAGATMADRQMVRGAARGNVPPWPSSEELDFHGTLAAIWIWARHQ